MVSMLRSISEPASTAIFPLAVETAPPTITSSPIPMPPFTVSALSTRARAPSSIEPFMVCTSPAIAAADSLMPPLTVETSPTINPAVIEMLRLT